MQGFQEAYKKLNQAQKQAVDTIYGPLLVVAGPGSGKTQILSLRVANILQKTDTLPGNILCLTFTDAAAINMRKRLVSVIGQDAYRVAIHTFHSFGTEIISRFPQFFYNAASLSPADDIAQIEALSNIFKKLSFDNPLNKTYFTQGFSYLKPVQKSIGQIKKAGLSPEEFLSVVKHNQKVLKELNPLFDSVFSRTVSKGILPEIKKLLSALEGLDFSHDFPVPHFEPINIIIEKSLALAFQNAEKNNTKPITEFKSKRLIKDENKNICFKDYLNFDKMTALAEVYEEYMREMRQNGYFDFDDMILDTIQTIQQNKVLAYELQEQYQFILVDEFQDTNDAQMRLLDLIARSEISQDQPNLMVVGDDDQAIYKFQGAELSNIIDFRERYQAQIISLIENYRSTKEILDLAREVILQGENRLENKIKDLNKELRAINPQKNTTNLEFKTFPTNSHELYWLGEKISSLIKSGVRPNEIAVIAREHKALQEAAKHLASRNIPIIYERQRNVLTEPHIAQIITLAEYILSLSNVSEPKDNLLPEILSYPFWQLDRTKIWEISLKSSGRNLPAGRQTWLETMKEFPDKNIKIIAQFLIELASISKYETLEHVLDQIIGSSTTNLDDEDENSINPNVRRPMLHVAYPASPFRDYYFSKKKLKQNPQEYIFFLSALKTFYYSLREHKKEEILKLQDMLEFVRLHQEHGLSLPDQTQLVDSRNAVNLMTGHKAKGQEFETVFIVSCQNEIWAKSKNFSLLQFPMNLEISPAGDNHDDQLRLFYVALTRSKKNLFLSSFETNAKGEPSLALGFVADKFSPETEVLSDQEIIEAISLPLLTKHAPPFEKSEKAMLDQFLSEYKLSPTHLNNFLDLSRGGPQSFIEQNLLQFPQAKSASGSFGSAIHKALEKTQVYLKNQEKLPRISEILVWFETALKSERLNENELDQYLAKGKQALNVYFEKNKNNFDPKDLVEVNFRNRGVILGNALLTGKIDKVRQIENNEIIVFDLKTGSPLNNWEGRGEYEKIKAYKYKNQLGFYKLLIENCPDFPKNKAKPHGNSDMQVNLGILEFVEAGKNEPAVLEFKMEKDFIKRLSKLIQAVYAKIINLDFPDVSKYSPDIKGILEFEGDLLSEFKI